MSVEVGFTGRFGNNLFQYAIGRLFAEKNNLEFLSKLPEHLQTTRPKSGRYFNSPIVSVNEGNVDGIFNTPAHEAKYIFSGFFQQAERYYNSRDLIKSFFVYNPPTTNTEDIAMHLRLDDYGEAHRIHWKWYKGILSLEKFDKLFIVTQNPSLNQHYIDNFNEWHPIIISSDPLSDFTFLSGFDRIICANSTFSWWAAFLGNPSIVYTFKSWLPIAEISLAEFPGAIVTDGDFLI